jgi:penicillin-binding protein 2
VEAKIPVSRKALAYINQATAGVVTEGTAAWKFTSVGWPQDKIELHAKTGTAEVSGKQTTSWLDTYSDDYAVVMTISQGGTGSGGSGDAIRKIYEGLYGVQKGGAIDPKKALLPKPQVKLPKFNSDGSAVVSTGYAPTAAPSTGTDQVTDTEQATDTAQAPTEGAPTGGASATGSTPTGSTPAETSALPPYRNALWADPRQDRSLA